LDFSLTLILSASYTVTEIFLSLLLGLVSSSKISLQKLILLKTLDATSGDVADALPTRRKNKAISRKDFFENFKFRIPLNPINNLI
jgi:hypothetical protein